MTMSVRSRLVAVTAAGTGLAAGLLLGVTGLASAAPTSGSTTTAASGGPAQHAGKHGGKGHREGREHHRAGALVTAVNGNTLTLDTPRGVQTVTLAAATRYQHGAAADALADVHAGEIVQVALVDPTATSPVAKTVRIELAHEAGYVQSANGSTVTIIDGNGFTRAVQENPTTSYRTNGATGSPSDVTVGRYIRVQGNVDANGATLDASKIAVGMGKRPARIPAGGGSAHSGTAGSSSAPSTNG